MSNTPTITIGMPVYNAEPWLRQSIGALLDQSFRDFVLIISDNASTDNTSRICKSLARGDARIRYHRNPDNIGVFRNYDKVFLHAETPYFKWASASDLCTPTFLEDCLAALEGNGAAVLAYPRTVMFTDDPSRGENYPDDVDIRDKSPVERFKRVLLELSLNNAINGLIRTHALRKTHLNEAYRGSDIVTLAELALQGEIVQIPKYLFLRRVNPKTATAFMDDAELREFFAAETRNVLRMPTWDFHRHCFNLALRAPVAFPNQILCATYVARRFWGRRRDFWHELSALILAMMY